MGGASVCSMATCHSNSKRPGPDGIKLRFFRFPKNPNTLKDWVRKCSRKDKWTPQNKRVCSKHFLKTDYEDEVQARILNIQPMKLKKDAIPTLCLPLDKSKENVVSKRDYRIKRKKNKELVDDLLQLDFEKPKTLENISMDISEVASTSKETDHDILEKQILLLKQENEQLKKKIEQQQNNEIILKQSLSKLEEENIKFKYDKDSNLIEKIKLALHIVLSPNQVDIALIKKSKACGHRMNSLKLLH